MNLFQFAQRLGDRKISELEKGHDVLVRIHTVLNANKRLTDYVVLFNSATTGNDIINNYANFPDVVRNALAKLIITEEEAESGSLVTKPWFKELAVGAIAVILMFSAFILFLFFMAYNAKNHLGYESNEVISWFLHFGELLLKVLQLQ